MDDTMEFMDTKTCQNLARSFAGESQARTRYALYAATARTEGWEYLARIFEQTAANELAHAEQFLEKLQQHGKQPIENIDVAAGYPFTHGVTMENLYEAAHSEEQEFLDVYPAFAAAAREEGFPDVAALWEQIAKIEGLHRDVFREAYSQMQTGTLYKKGKPIVWRCANCGYIVLAEEAWKVCPVCKKPQGWVIGDLPERKLPES